MLITIISISESSIPKASYDLIVGQALEESESLEISSSPQIPLTSAVLLNDSLSTDNPNWLVEPDIRHNSTTFWRWIQIPKQNVSSLIFRLSSYIVSGPLEITMGFDEEDYSSVGNNGEHIEIERHTSPSELSSGGLIELMARFDGMDRSVIDQLIYTIELEFTTGMCPLTVDLQRTDGESMFLLQEFLTLNRYERPVLLLNENKFHLNQANATIFVPNGIYSVSIDWSNYEHSFININVTNESIILELRIKSIRLKVESIQKIPGLVVMVGSYISDFYYFGILVADEPTFYLPSGSYEEVSVRGNIDSWHYPRHFRVDLSQYENRNITLVVNENWIIIRNVAFTPGRLITLIAIMSIIILTILLSRKELAKSSAYAPFILLLLGNSLPIYATTQLKGTYPHRIPLFSNYIETQAVCSGIGTSISSMSGTATAISGAEYSVASSIGIYSFMLLFIVFLTVVYEYVRKEYDLETSDFLIAAPILCSLIINLVFIVNVFISNLGFRTITLGPGLMFTALALLVWIIQYRRQGKTILQTN
jgi:hypothetical protein